MSRFDFKRLDDLFNEANTLPPEQWDEFIRHRCTDEPELAGRLAAMLEADRTGDDPLAAAVTSGDEFEVPDRIGPYEVVRPLGRGGMGQVFLGRRRLGEAEQRVAIKLLSSATSPRVLLERFDQERAVLARLSHPNIAGLIDAGETASGIPYVAMDYVDGVSLTEYAESRGLGLAGRLAVFGQLCDAVGYAHRNLVVHRDLKPDNVLVDAEGHLKLLDFGIAKLLPEEGEAARGTLTRAGAMTPPYASPEQVRGDPITTQSDVYSLGVVLYELLTGHLPYRVTARSSTLELERQICETQPQAPSARESIALPARKIRGDLDRIVLKALRKEPQRRYESVALLFGDIERFQRGLPVSARPDSLGYRVGRLIARNPLGVSLAALLVVTLAAFAVTSHWQAQQLAAERDRARQEAEAANSVADFMVGLFQVTDPRESAEGGEVSARDLLDRAAESITGEMDAAPLLRARLMHVIGLAYSNIGDYQSGMSMLESALAIRERELGPDSLEVSDSLNRIGNFHRMYGRLDEAEKALERALAIRRGLDLGPSYELADAHNNFGLFQYEIGRNQRAIDLLDQAIDLHRNSPEPARSSIAVSLHNKALALNRLGRYTDAQAAIEEALSIKREEGLQDRSTFANSLAVLANTERHRGDLDSAWRHREQSLAIRRAVYPAAHPNLVSGLIGWAALAIDRRELEPAEPWLTEALEIALETGGENSLLEARVRMVTGRLALARGRTEAAVAEFERALTIRDQRLRPENPLLWDAQLGVAEAYLAAGRPDRAAPLASRVASARVKRFGNSHSDVLESKVILASIALAKDDRVAARGWCLEVIEEPLPEPSFDAERHRARAHDLLAALDGEPAHDDRGVGRKPGNR